jgi:hypothetical protein
MIRLFNTYKRLLMVCMIWGCALSAMAFTSSAHSSIWSTQPTFSNDVRPSYQFRSTSSYTSSVNTTVFEPMAESPYSRSRIPGVRRDGYWTPDGEWVEDNSNPIGELPNLPTTPIGEPFILVGLAILYFLFRRARLKRKNHLSCLCS